MSCNCGKTRNKEGRCDGSHSLTDEQYRMMTERMEQREAAAQQRRAQAADKLA